MVETGTPAEVGDGDVPLSGVRIKVDRREEFVASPTRQPTEIHIRTGAKADGTFTFRDIEFTHDNGGYTSWGATTPFVMMQTFSSLYRVPHVRMRGRVVYTNNPYAGSMRGYGNLQATFAVEGVNDRIAAELGMDPPPATDNHDKQTATTRRKSVAA